MTRRRVFVALGTAFAALLTLTFGFRASCGSDWHGPGESWMDFGEVPEMPPGVVPIWTGW